MTEGAIIVSFTFARHMDPVSVPVLAVSTKDGLGPSCPPILFPLEPFRTRQEVAAEKTKEKRQFLMFCL